MATAEVFPFAQVGDAGAYPAWIRNLRRQSGVYIIRDLHSGQTAYVGESSSDRLYSTLTRHLQKWTNKFDTAGATYDRADVEIAVIVVPRAHANYLQNELICVLDPPDNRLLCDQLFDLLEDAGDDAPADERIDREHPPRGYDYDVDLLLDGIDYQWPTDSDDYDVPF